MANLAWFWEKLHSKAADHAQQELGYELKGIWQQPIPSSSYASLPAGPTRSKQEGSCFLAAEERTRKLQDRAFEQMRDMQRSASEPAKVVAKEPKARSLAPQQLDQVCAQAEKKPQPSAPAPHQLRALRKQLPGQALQQPVAPQQPVAKVPQMLTKVGKIERRKDINTQEAVGLLRQLASSSSGSAQGALDKDAAAAKSKPPRQTLDANQNAMSRSASEVQIKKAKAQVSQQDFSDRENEMRQMLYATSLKGTKDMRPSSKASTRAGSASSAAGSLSRKSSGDLSSRS